MPMGGSAIARHGAFDAKATVYSGKQPVKTVPVALGTLAETLPATEGSQTVTVTAQIKEPATGTYTLHPGFEDSTHAVVMLDGKEFYRKEVGGKPVCTKIALETGRRYPITIPYPECYGPSKRVPAKTVCEKDVLLLRQTFGLPPLKDGHRYRSRVHGSVHANSGEGYAIYVKYSKNP
jgi:hypothetical protein